MLRNSNSDNQRGNATLDKKKLKNFEQIKVLMIQTYLINLLNQKNKESKMNHRKSSLKSNRGNRKMRLLKANSKRKTLMLLIQNKKRRKTLKIKKDWLMIKLSRRSKMKNKMKQLSLRSMRT